MDSIKNNLTMAKNTNSSNELNNIYTDLVEFLTGPEYDKNALIKIMHKYIK